jgi:hypothetical protein
MRSKFAPLAFTRVAGSVSDLIGRFVVWLHKKPILVVRKSYPCCLGIYVEKFPVSRNKYLSINSDWL